MTHGMTDGSRQKKANGHTRYIQTFAAEKRWTTIQLPNGTWTIRSKASTDEPESDKCPCGSAQTTKHLWESKSELKHLQDTEPNLTKILQDKDKLLVKEMEKRLKDEEYQSKTRNAGN